MSKAIANLVHERGATITFGLRSHSPEYDGTEVVDCDVKKVVTGLSVPPESASVIFSIEPVFVPAVQGEPAYWLFEISAEQSAALDPGQYITDAKIALQSGVVSYAKPLGIKIEERVTK